MAKHKKKTTLEDVLTQVKDLSTNLAQDLEGLSQNVNSVGQVAAGNSPNVSAGSARAGLGGPGFNFKPYAIIAGLGVAAYLLVPKLK